MGHFFLYADRNHCLRKLRQYASLCNGVVQLVIILVAFNQLVKKSVTKNSNRYTTVHKNRKH